MIKMYTSVGFIDGELKLTGTPTRYRYSTLKEWSEGPFAVYKPRVFRASKKEYLVMTPGVPGSLRTYPDLNTAVAATLLSLP